MPWDCDMGNETRANLFFKFYKMIVLNLIIRLASYIFFICFFCVGTKKLNEF